MSSYNLNRAIVGLNVTAVPDSPDFLHGEAIINNDGPLALRHSDHANFRRCRSKTALGGIDHPR